MNRRIMLALLGVACFGLVGGCILHSRQAEKNASCTKELFAMDTYMEFTAYGKNCEQAVDDAMEKVQELDALLSTGSATSQVTQLNQSGSLVADETLAAIMTQAQDYYKKTNGIFDYTIYPVMQLWGFPTQEYHVATEEELAKVLPLVDGSLPTLDEDSHEITLGDGQEVDFGGIAKGYTGDAVMEVFRKYGISSGMISLGGNIQVLNEKPDGSKWNIGIRNPEGSTSDVLGAVAVDNKAVVTSGGYERYFEEDGQTYIHIIDPRTGKPADSDLVSVTIVSADGTMADALSTSLYIMGLEQAHAYWSQYRDQFDAVLITEDGEVYVTEGIADDYTDMSGSGNVQILH